MRCRQTPRSFAQASTTRSHRPNCACSKPRTGREGIDLAAAEEPALVVLDLGLPDMEGIAVCREIRRWSSTPILVLSARHADTEKVALLDAGADDYMTKPFSSSELMARVRAQFRRARGGARRSAYDWRT